MESFDKGVKTTMHLNRSKLVATIAGLTVILLGCDKLIKTNGSSSGVAYEINGKKVTVEEIQKTNPGTFYEVEKRKAEMIHDLAQTAYLDNYFTELGKKDNKNKDEAQKAYIAQNVKVSDEEMNATLQRVANHPNLASMSDEEKKKAVRNYLEQSKGSQVIRNLIDTAIKEKKLVLSYPIPEEPRYNVAVTADDVVRFGPNPQDTTPNGCKGDDCAITIVEYSEFQCPFCSRVLPTSKQVLEKYKGKIRWIVRNFPLDFHPNARSAAHASLCAHQQGKYWEMYQILFENQRELEKEKLAGYAEKAGLDKAKYEACMNTATAEMNKKIDEQMRVAQTYGVSGTPAFFINGRKISGALPFENFEKIIEEELAAKKKS
jgi:protein-disulfide isomerase